MPAKSADGIATGLTWMKCDFFRSLKLSLCGDHLLIPKMQVIWLRVGSYESKFLSWGNKVIDLTRNESDTYYDWNKESRKEVISNK